MQLYPILKGRLTDNTFIHPYGQQKVNHAGSVKEDQSVSTASKQVLKSYMLSMSSYSPAFCAEMIFFELLSCKMAKDFLKYRCLSPLLM